MTPGREEQEFIALGANLPVMVRRTGGRGG